MIPWNGGPCPVPRGTQVRVLHRDGAVYQEIVGSMYSVRWEHADDDTDIVGYHIVVQKSDALSKQVGGNHYKDKAIQPLEYIHANKLGFCEGNVIKYVTRWKDKNGIADLEKAKHYIELLIELEGKK